MAVQLISCSSSPSHRRSHLWWTLVLAIAKRQKTWSRSPPTSRGDYAGPELPNTLHSRHRLYRISVYSLSIPRWFSRVHSGSTNVPARNQVRCLRWRWHESPPQCCPWTNSIWRKKGDSTFHSKSPRQVQPQKEQTCHPTSICSWLCLSLGEILHTCSTPVASMHALHTPEM